MANVAQEVQLLACFALSNVQELGSDGIWGTAAIWEVELVMSESSICKSLGIIHLQGVTIKVAPKGVNVLQLHMHTYACTCIHS